jgi:hypothetical protein
MTQERADGKQQKLQFQPRMDTDEGNFICGNQRNLRMFLSVLIRVHPWLNFFCGILRSNHF